MNSTLVNEFRLEDVQGFKKYLRMSALQLELILNLVTHQIIRQDTKLLDAIPVHDRLIMVTLRFLASYKHIKYVDIAYLFFFCRCTSEYTIEFFSSPVVRLKPEK